MPVPVFGGYDPDAMFHFGRMVSTDSALRDAINNFIVGAKADRTWTKIKAISLVADNAADSLLDLKGGYDASTVNSPAFSVDRGFTISESANAYIDSNFPANNLSRTSHCLFAYARASLSDFGYLLGAGDATQSSVTLMNDSTTGYINFYGDTWGYSSSPKLGAVLGFIGGSRFGNTEILRINANEASSVLSSPLDAAIDVKNIFVGNFNGFAVAPLDGVQFAAWGFAEGLTSAELSSLRDRVQTYMVARGAAV